MLVLAHVIEDSTEIFGILRGGFEHPKPLGTPLHVDMRFLQSMY